MSVIGFIFARGGSKGLPGKNTRIFNGKPLIAWTIEQAKLAPSIDRIIVSTDSEEIAAVAIKYGAEVPFLRPKELAGDTSSEWLAWKHALGYLYDKNALPEVMICLPVTAPLRFTEDIENCIAKFKQGNSDIVITVSEAHRNPYFNMVKIDGSGYASILMNENGRLVKRRQDAPDVFDITTVAYVANPLYVLASENMFEGRVSAVQIPVERSIDIDTLYDFNVAEFLMKTRVIHE